MRKANIVLFIFLIVVVLTSTVYFSFFYGKDTFDYTNLNNAYSELMEQTEYDEIKDLEIKVYKEENENKDGYAMGVSFTPKVIFQDVKILVIDGEKPNDIIFTAGLVDDKIFNLIPDCKISDTQMPGIKFLISKEGNINKLLVYFSYLKENERITNYYEVNVNA